MITIFSRIAIRFMNPDPRVALVSKPKPNEKPEESSQRVMVDASSLGSHHKRKQLFFDTSPGEVQTAPDWVKEGDDNKWLWEKHGADGNLMEVKTTVPVEVASAGAELDEDEDNGKDEPSDATEALFTEGEGIQRDQNDSARPVAPGSKRKKVVG
jgi:hypothetical protein